MDNMKDVILEAVEMNGIENNVDPESRTLNKKALKND